MAYNVYKRWPPAVHSVASKNRLIQLLSRRVCVGAPGTVSNATLEVSQIWPGILANSSLHEHVFQSVMVTCFNILFYVVIILVYKVLYT